MNAGTLKRPAGLCNPFLECLERRFPTPRNLPEHLERVFPRPVALQRVSNAGVQRRIVVGSVCSVFSGRAVHYRRPGTLVGSAE